MIFPRRGRAADCQDLRERRDNHGGPVLLCWESVGEDDTGRQDPDVHLRQPGTPVCGLQRDQLFFFSVYKSLFEESVYEKS